VNTLDLYIARVVAAGTGVAMLIVMGLDVFFSVIDEIGDVGRGSYDMSQMLQYVALTLPRGIYEFFPMAALLGSILGMGALAASSELTAIRTAGVSVTRIVRSVLQIGLLMTLGAILLGELIAPAAEEYGQNMRAFALHKDAVLKGREGLWARDGNRYINVRKILADERLADLSVYEFDDQNRLLSASHARRALHRDSGWLLEDVEQSLVSEDGVQVRRFESLVSDSLLSPEMVNVVTMKPRNMSAIDLHRYIIYLQENGLDASHYRLAFWMRFSTPLSALVMMFLSVPFVFSALRSVGVGQRMFSGVLVGVVFYLLSQMLSHLGQVYGINPLISAFTPSLLFMTIAFVALRRV
jgi:lipopolysaccharide export system permease protein